MKDAVFLGTSLEDLQAFPDAARRSAGYEIDQVQRGELPRDWKPMPTVGPAIREIRIHADGEFRIIYCMSFAEAVYIIHAFAKKTEQTAKQDIQLAASRFRTLIRYRAQKGLA